MDTIVDQAIALHLPVFPCLGATKAPATPHGFKDAAIEPSRISQLWRRYPGELIGVPTGSSTGITVLDVDAPQGFIWFNSHVHRLPETRIHVTRRGGFHMLYRTPNPPLKNSVSLVGRNIDIRGEGGYIIWWPASGGEFASEAVIAEFPRWIISYLKRKKTLLEKRQQGEVYSGDTHNIERLLRFVKASREGERNNRLFWSACRAGGMVARGEISRAAAETALFEAAAACAWPDHSEILRTIRNGIQRGK
jgi:Bifunctional DNA primase/polymerase, N-terminal